MLLVDWQLVQLVLSCLQRLNLEFYYWTSSRTILDFTYSLAFAVQIFVPRFHQTQVTDEYTHAGVRKNEEHGMSRLGILLRQ